MEFVILKFCFNIFLHRRWLTTRLFWLKCTNVPQHAHNCKKSFEWHFFYQTWVRSMQCIDNPGHWLAHKSIFCILNLVWMLIFGWCLLEILKMIIDQDFCPKLLFFSVGDILYLQYFHMRNECPWHSPHDHLGKVGGFLSSGEDNLMLCFCTQSSSLDT